MSLIKFNRKRFPLSYGMPTWFDTEDRFVDDLFSKGNDFPAMNVKEHKKDFEIELAVPGFTKDEIQVSLEDDVLHVCAKKSEEMVEDEEGYYRKEFSYNEFDRKFKLPTSINEDEKIKAVYKDGILRLNLIKKEEAKIPPKKVIQIT